MAKRYSKGVGIAGLVALLGIVTLTTMGCSDDDDAPAGPKGGSAGQGAGGEAGANGGTGGTTLIGGAGGQAGGAGEGGGAGALACDCSQDDNSAHVPLECACAAGLCSTLEHDLAAYPESLGEAYYLLLGSCADGYRTLRYEEAQEQGGTRTYDSTGHMVYESRGPYVSVPTACGFDFSFGELVIGENPAQGCSYCLVSARDNGEGGAGGQGGTAGEPAYPESATAPCTPEQLQLVE